MGNTMPLNEVKVLPEGDGSAGKTFLPKKIFISYSHKDEDWKNRLVTQLKALKDKFTLIIWDDSEIRQGEEWEKKINEAINEADAAIMLISADYLSSDFISEKEIPVCLAQKAKKNMQIFPIILKSCAWTKCDWLEKIQVWPRNGNPLASFSDNAIETLLSVFTSELHDILTSPNITPYAQENSAQESEIFDQKEKTDDDLEIEEENILLLNRLIIKRLIIGALVGIAIGSVFGLFFGRVLSEYVDHMTSIIFNGIAGAFIGAATWKKKEEINLYPLIGGSVGFFAWFVFEFGLSVKLDSDNVARSFIYGPATGAIIGVIIKFTRNIITRIKTKGEKTVHLLINISPKLKEVLIKLARREGKNPQQMIKEILENYVENSK
ncbi:MAG: toll/interleukin-1 receptor domain-containing protein [Candidatus Aminicenantes bacterium]|nr:toll/interleukin-1 receptor domain-containing protein [Candidatus Aminicenantes bacterium]